MYKIWDKVKVVIDDVNVVWDSVVKLWEHIFFWTINLINISWWGSKSYFISWNTNPFWERDISIPTQEELDLYYN